MEEYKYIESNAILNYFKTNKPNLSIINFAEIIWRNLKFSIKEKNKAYEKLISTMDDTNIKPTDSANFTSSKEFLRLLIAEQKSLLKKIYSKEHECYVTFHYLDKNKTEWTETIKTYDFQAVIDEELEYQYENLKYIVIYIEELKFKGLVNSAGKLVHINQENVNNSYTIFNNNQLSTTLPFKKGDILINNNIELADPKPFIFEKVDNNMSRCFGLNLDDNLYHNQKIDEDIWHLDYYLDDKTPKFQYLKALSLFTQKEISELELAKIRDFAKIKIKQDEMIGILDFNENTRDILYNLMG